MIIVSISEQMLHHRRKSGVWYSYPISTARNGSGNVEGSFQTPPGKHRIAEKIGDGMPLLTAFKARRPIALFDLADKRLFPLPCETHTFRMTYKQKSRRTFADQTNDWILTRILWLEGCETGKNRRGSVDTKHRYIYIHGTHDEAAIGTPCSHGCIRMRNLNMLELFENTSLGERVNIRA